MYVISINPENNTVTIGDNHELFTKKIYINDLSFLSGEAPENELSCFVKIRCAARPAEAVMRLSENGAVIEFSESQRAAAPGQTAAIYTDDILIGGGIICNP